MRIIIILLLFPYISWAQCFPESFVTQTQVDSFLILYPQCTSAEYITIRGDLPECDITNTDALSNLRYVRYLRLYMDSSRVYSLNGLRNVDSCVRVEIETNTNISDPLFSLKYLDSLDIDYSSEITALNCLNALENVGWIRIGGQGPLDILPSLSPQDSLSIWLLRRQGGTLSALLRNPENHSLGTAFFSNGVSHLDLSGLAHVKNIEYLSLSDIDSVDLGFLSTFDFPRSLSLSRVPEYLIDSVFFHRDTFRVLTISRMNSMSTLSDFFPSLRHIQSTLELIRNDQLHDISLLQGFNLPDLPLISERDQRISIWGNASLETCNVDYLCDAIEAFPSNRIRIDRNGLFCHDDTLQRYGCMTVSVDHDISPNAEVFPNPFSDVLSIDNYSGRVSILDLLGRPLSFHVISHSDQLDVSFLLPGVYIVRLENEGGPVDFRVVKSQ